MRIIYANKTRILGLLCLIFINIQVVTPPGFNYVCAAWKT